MGQAKLDRSAQWRLDKANAKLEETTRALLARGSKKEDADEADKAEDRAPSE